MKTIERCDIGDLLRFTASSYIIQVRFESFAPISRLELVEDVHFISIIKHFLLLLCTT